MTKISIFSLNKIFAADLAEQIKLFVPDSETMIDKSNADLIIVDEDKQMLEHLAIQNNGLPLIFLSSAEDKPPLADAIIKKPLNLHNMLEALQKNTLLPKVRRKECLNFKEYSFYPVKKEIMSSITKITVKLTEKEVEILKYLYQISPEIASKEMLLENVWKYSADATTHTIETHIYRLRQKVEQNGGSQLIITENNGYRLNV